MPPRLLEPLRDTSKLCGTRCNARVTDLILLILLTKLGIGTLEAELQAPALAAEAAKAAARYIIAMQYTM